MSDAATPPNQIAYGVGRVIGNVAGTAAGALTSFFGGVATAGTDGAAVLAGSGVATVGGAAVAANGVVATGENIAKLISNGGSGGGDDLSFEEILDMYDMDGDTHNWGDGDVEDLLRHYEDHNDFGAEDIFDYARMANDFYNNRGQYEVKVDQSGNIHVYDRSTNTFGAYNKDGSTRTFFKPDQGASYFDKQLWK